MVPCAEVFLDAPSAFHSDGGETAEFTVPPEFERFVTRDKAAKTFGRLFSARAFWVNVLHTSVVILSWLTVGYPIPWADPSVKCPPAVFENSRECFKACPISPVGRRENFVSSSVLALQETGATVIALREELTMISPLSVDVHRDTLRLILNLRYVIQNAFHHVMVLVEDQPYLGFCWEHSCYELRVLPFGLAPSPLVFF